MEHAQRVCANIVLAPHCTGLNPYFNGTCSKRNLTPRWKDEKELGLNPYFNGTCSKSSLHCQRTTKQRKVLILILMEHAQRDDNTTPVCGVLQTS